MVERAKCEFGWLNNVRFGWRIQSVDATQVSLEPQSLAVADITPTIAPVGPAQLSTYTVQSGDTLSGIAGTSDPEAIGILMAVNGLSSSTIQPGMQLQLGDLGDYSSGQVVQFGQSGQAVLNQDNASLAALNGGAGSAAPFFLGHGQGADEQVCLSAVTHTAGVALPAVEEPAFAQPGYFEQAQTMAVQGYSDLNNSWLQRGAFFGLAVLEETLNLAEGMANGIANIGPEASIAAQNLAAASLTSKADDRLAYYGKVLGAGGTSLLNLAGAGGLLSSTLVGTAWDVSGNVSLDVVPNTTKTIADVSAPTLDTLDAQRNVLNTFQGGNAVETAYGEGSSLYRVADRNGAYWTTEPPPSTELQWRMDYAVQGEWNNMSNLYRIDIPQGSSLTGLEGIAGPQRGALFGGKTKVFLDWRNVPEDWITTVPLRNH